MKFDVAIIGGGMAGMATALRLQARGLSTVVLEAHGQPGGCAGFFRRRGFSFDVGATTLVDFEPGGVGGELLESVGLAPLAGESLPGYVAWLPDRVVTLHRDPVAWAQERLRALGDSPAHRGFWQLIDRLAAVFWRASRRGVRLPIKGARELSLAVRSIGLRDLPLVRYLGWTMGDALRAHGLRGDRALVGLLSMLIEDTLHSTVDDAPLINAALGVTIRGAGLTRARGGMRGFWLELMRHYDRLGGVLRVGCPVNRVAGRAGFYAIETRRGTFEAGQVVAAVPAGLAAGIGPVGVPQALGPYLARDRGAQGGALVAFLGVPEEEVAGQEFTHHQLLEDYAQPLGHGNNMFISVSRQGDTMSAPEGHRAVMISTHCELEDWEGLGEIEYAARKAAAFNRLIELARRVYPDLGRRAIVREMGTPRTFERFTGRPRGAVGGFRQTLFNSNQNAIPHDLGIPGFFLAGDTTWPGLGTVACVLGSRVVAEHVLAGVKPRGRSSKPRMARAQSKRGQPAMPSTALSDPALPALDELGRDLTVTTRRERRLALARPFLGLAAYALAVYAGVWWLTPWIVFLIFVAVVTVTHDVVHNSLGLSARATDCALFAMGAVLLESGHAYRATHLRHHRVFPGPDDPEGDPARMGFWCAVFCGPIFLPRLWFWAYRRSRPGSTARRWLLVEAAWPVFVIAAGCALIPITPAVLIYVALAVIGSWVYPLLTVHLPHRHYGETPLSQTHTLRGRIIPALFLELTYHLEHHLYPEVPSHNLSKLSRRLDPLFRAAGVRPRRVP